MSIRWIRSILKRFDADEIQSSYLKNYTVTVLLGTLSLLALAEQKQEKQK